MKFQPMSSQIFFFFLSKSVGYTISISSFGGKKSVCSQFITCFCRPDTIAFGIWIQMHCLNQNNCEEIVSSVLGSSHFRHEGAFCLLLAIVYVLI